MSKFPRWMVFIAILAHIGFVAPIARAINTAAGPNGARITIVKQANTFNLTGMGINLGQVELSRPADPDVTNLGVFETAHVDIDPGGLGAGVVGVARINGGPTLNGGEINTHATSVAGVLAGNGSGAMGTGTFGVAHNAALFSSAMFPPGSAAANAQLQEVRGSEWVRTRGGGVPIINYSFGQPLQNAQHPAAVAVRDGRSLLAQYVDFATQNNNVLFVQAGQETGVNTNTTPEDAFNNIVVAYSRRGPSGRFDRVDPGSLQNMVIPAAGGAATRNKVDMIAPGRFTVATGGLATMTDVNVDGTRNDYRSANGTSFSAPLVAGTAALLQQRATAAGLPRGHLLLKAALLNSASKHIRDRTGTPWPLTYAARNPELTNPNNAPPDQIMHPLDPDTGAGQLNALAAVQQYQGPAEPHHGLRGNRVGPGDREDHFNLRRLHAGALVTATLTWDRIVTNAGGVAPTLPQLQVLGNYNIQPFQDLDFSLQNADTNSSVARSISTDENVEHIYFNVPTTGRYRLEVNNFTNTRTTPYAVAWNAGSTDGAAFSVDRNAEGLAQNPIGILRPNDVYALGTAGPANFQTEGEIFVSGYDFANMQRISGALATRSRVGPHNAPPAATTLLDDTGATRGVMGMRPGDNIVGLSWGRDGTAGLPGVPLFSVDPASMGAGGSHVNQEAVTSPIRRPVTTPRPMNPLDGDPGDEAAGDIFRTPRFDEFGAYASRFARPAPAGSNRLFKEDSQLGLQAPRTRGSLLGGQEDDLDALEEDSPLTTVDRDGDGLHNRGIFFLLDPASPSIAAAGTGGVPAGASPDDIFLSPTPGPFAIYATGEQVLRLNPHPAGVELDALVLSDVAGIPVLAPDGRFLPRFKTAYLNFPDGRLDPGHDTALISFTRGHAPPGADSSSIYFTDFQRMFNPDTHFKALEPQPDGTLKLGSYYALAGQFGTLANDDLNALDIRRTPRLISKRFQLDPGLARIIDPQTDTLQFAVVLDDDNQPVETTTIRLEESFSIDQGLVLPTEVHAFDSGGVDQVFVGPEGDQPGLTGFFETFLSQGQQMPNQSFFSFHIDIKDPQGQPLELKPFSDGSVVTESLSNDRKLFESEFFLRTPGHCQFWRLDTEIAIEQDLQFEFVGLFPDITGVGIGDIGGGFSSLDLVVQLISGPGFDPLLPLFGSTIEAFVPSPTAGVLALVAVAGMAARRYRPAGSSRWSSRFATPHRGSYATSNGNSAARAAA